MGEGNFFSCLAAASTLFIRDHAKFIRYPGQAYRQGAQTFLREKGGLRFILGEVKGGNDFLRGKKGTRTFCEEKNGRE